MAVDDRTTPAPRDASEDEWARASRIARELDRVLDGRRSRREALPRAAAELRLSTRQIYNLLARYRVDRRVSALLPRTPTTRRGRIDPEVERIIEATLRALWLREEEPALAEAVGEVRARCEEAGLARPAYVTVGRRIAKLFSPEEIARKRGCDDSRLRRLKPRPGYIRAKHALEVCQIDHTPGDIQFAEIVGDDGVYVGRPYLTLAADVASGAVTGFCLTLERPSRMSVALCLAHAMCPKEDWLKAHRIDHDWPLHGRPGQLVVDGGAEFWSDAFVQGCRDFGVAIRRRNRGTVHHGGLVERLLGKLNAVLRSLPGRTGSSVADRAGYPSERRARLSFRDLERCVVLAIIDHNLSQNPRKLTTPLDEWRRRCDGLPRPVDDPMAVLVNFMPRELRRISPQGVSLFAIDYYEPWLGRLVARRDRLDKLDVRHDPRDVSCVYVRDPDTGRFRPVRRRDGETRATTLWEHRDDRRRRALAGARGAQETVKIRREIRAVVAEAKTPKQRLRDAVRSREAAAAEKPHQALRPAVADPPPPNPDRPKRVFPVENW